MARMVSLLKFDQRLVENWITVTIGDQSETARETVREAKEWLADPNRAGRYAVTACGTMVKTYWVFVFTDADTAFEFKMAWG